MDEYMVINKISIIGFMWKKEKKVCVHIQISIVYPTKGYYGICPQVSWNHNFPTLEAYLLIVQNI
jgi:hypothetical protein